jgi:uncharacterized protein YqhQ
MEIEILPPDNNQNFDDEIKKLKRANELGCLVLALVILAFLYVFLALLPVMLIVLAYAFVFALCYYIYKAYLEGFLRNIFKK